MLYPRAPNTVIVGYIQDWGACTVSSHMLQQWVIHIHEENASSNNKLQLHPYWKCALKPRPLYCGPVPKGSYIYMTNDLGSQSPVIWRFHMIQFCLCGGITGSLWTCVCLCRSILPSRGWVSQLLVCVCVRGIVTVDIITSVAVSVDRRWPWPLLSAGFLVCFELRRGTSLNVMKKKFNKFCIYYGIHWPL